MSGALARFAAVLRTPHVAPLLSAAVLARLPIGIHSLAVVLFLRETTGSYAVAGGVAAALVGGAALGGPPQGRLIDRLGQRRVLVPLLSLHVAGLAGLLVLGEAGAPPGLLGVMAFVAGACLPQMSSVMRSLWPVLMRSRENLMPAVFALDSFLIEMIFVAGPLLTALVTAVLAPQWAIVLAAAFVTGGTLWFISQPPSREFQPRSEAGTHGLAGPLSSAGMRTLIAVTLPIGFCFGAIELVIPAFVEDEDRDRALAGVLLAVWSLSSALGALVYGGRDRVSALADRYVLFALLMPLLFLPIAAASSVGVMIALLVPSGAFVAPLLASSNQLIGQVAPPGTLTEAYTWGITSLAGGVALGNAAAGTVIEARGWPAACLTAAGAALVGALVALARRSTLASPGPVVSSEPGMRT